MPIKLAEIKKENDEKEKKDIEQKYNVVGGLKLAKSSTNSKSENKPWYKNVVKGSNLFDDGYDLGDITRTTLNTAINVGANLLKGVSNIGDAVAKTIVGGIATGADILGYDNYADKLKYRLAGKDEEVNERLKNYTLSGLLQKASDATKSNSVVGDTTRDVAQGVGYYAGMLAGQSVGIPWQVTSGVTSVGSELPEAYAEGATNAQAWLSAGISAGAEIGSEYIFGGIKLPGTGKTTETILNKTTNKVKNKALKYITQAGINILGEGAEEVISGIGSALGKQLTYMSDKELNEIYSNEDKLQDFIMGTLVSAVTIGANPTTYQNIKTGRSLINGLTVDEEGNLANTNNNKNNINNNQNSSFDLDNFKEKKGAVLDKTSLSIMADESAHGSFNDTNIPQTDIKVNSDTSTKYSMPLKENNTQDNNSSYEKKIDNAIDNIEHRDDRRFKKSIEENIENLELDNSSFSFADAKRYDDLIKTNYIEYFRKDNGDVKVYLMDSNNNLLNEFNVWSNTNAIKELGTDLGSKIYETASDTYQKIGIGNDINNLGTETDYFMNHRPSEGYGNASNFEKNMPDIFEHPEWYLNLDEKYNKESLNALKKVRSNPEAELTIYRATVGNKINPGDWVTPSKLYAEYHNNSQFDGKGNILEMKVKAKDIQFAGDDINEFGYFPGDSAKYSQNNSLWQAHLEKNYKSNGTRTYFDDVKLKGNEILKSNTRYSEIIKNESDNKKAKKILNPNEIANLSENDALTTPELSKVKVEKGDGESNYWSNIKDKTNMLNTTQKEHILSNDEVKYYKKITNEESLNEAFEKLNKGGASETLRWAKMDSKDATATDVAEGWILLKQYSDSGDYNSMVEVAKKMRDIGTKAGQTVQAFNIMARMSPEGMVKYAQSELSDAYEKMVKGKTKEWIDKYKNDFDLKPNEVQFIMDTMQEVKDMPDGYDKKVKLAEIQKMMTDKLPPDKDGRIKSWMRISMLFNPKTQVRNVAGNAIIAPVNYVGDFFASKMDKKIAKKTGVRTTGTMNVKAILEGMKKGAYQATNDYKKGINTKDMDGNRFEISNRKSFSDKNLIGKSLNRTEALLNYVMDAGDRVFSEASFENSLQNQMILNNATEVTQEMIDIAHEEALSRTWNDNNKYTKFVLGVRSGLNNIKLGGYGLGDVLIPFAKTPANLTKAIVDYSPVGLVNSLTKYKAMNNAIETGQFTAKMQHDFVQTLGKATAGTMLYVLGMALAKAGITSGKSDDDKDTRDFIKNTLGINSYSIKIGNKSFTYDWAQPIAAPLSIMANIETSKKNKEQALLEGVVNSLDTAGSILLEQSFLSSINDVLSDNAGVVSGIINEVLELPSRAIPTFSKQIVDLTDTTQRQTYEYDKPLQTATNKIKAKLPGLSKTLSPSVDTMGREILRYGGKNNIFNVFLNPANVNTENISESASEIYRVYKVTGDQTIMPRVTPYYINQNGEKTILSTKERTEYAKVSGKIIEDNIKLLLKNSNYVKLEDEEKSQIIKNIVDYSYNKAREDVMGIEMSNTYNGVKTYTMAKGQISDYYLAKKAVSDVKDKYKGDTTAIKTARKQAIFNYINKLNISKAKKTILFGVTTNYSIKSYRAYLFNYINKLDITKKEKEEIWNKLYD